MDRSYFSLTFMWESNKYREDTYHLQKSFSKFVMDRSCFSLTFMWESFAKVIFKVCHGQVVFFIDIYVRKLCKSHFQSLSWTSRIFHWRLCEKAINIGKIHTTCKSHFQSLSWTSHIFHWLLCEKAINIGKIHTTCKSNFQSLWKIDSWVVPSIQLDMKVHGTLWTASTPNSFFTSMSLYYQISQSFTMICHLIE